MESRFSNIHLIFKHTHNVGSRELLTNVPVNREDTLNEAKVKGSEWLQNVRIPTTIGHLNDDIQNALQKCCNDKAKTMSTDVDNKQEKWFKVKSNRHNGFILLSDSSKRLFWKISRNECYNRGDLVKLRYNVEGYFLVNAEQIDFKRCCSLQQSKEINISLK
ncbi:hypothetical protein GJ496_007994 [Pomphorhynchus laevis]|nr:hypothetical protein GJ496_007994 [Pomphorhynchus laevis]